jgi:hypothetical protein
MVPMPDDKGISALPLSGMSSGGDNPGANGQKSSNQVPNQRGLGRLTGDSGKSRVHRYLVGQTERRRA